MANSKDVFIATVQKLFDENEVPAEAVEFFEDYKKCKKEPKEMTDKGAAILVYMQENKDARNNVFTSAIIGEAIGQTARSVSGSMRKLISGEFVEKIGQNPVSYAITDKGMLYTVDNTENL